MIELLRLYWKPLAVLAIALSLFFYIGLLRHKITALQRDNASLHATIDLTKALGQAANEKADRIEQGAHAAAIASTNQYLTDLAKVKNYNATHPVSKPSPVRVCHPTTDSGSSQVPAASTSTSGTDASAADEVPSGSSLDADCRITTLMLLRLQDFERGQQAIH